jgi:uncharacterized protein (TIGR01777 family)
MVDAIKTSKTILVTGATGFIGQSLCRELLDRGDKVVVLTRDYKKAEKLFGSEVKIVTDLDELEADIKLEAVMSLAGAPVVAGLWTKKRKQVLINSRINDLTSIKKLCERLDNKPEVLINASAIGYYGMRGDEVLTENEKGQDIFQSILCQKRESLASSFAEYGMRVCNMRIGLVFGNDGGAYPQMTRPIRFGLGAVFGNGKQYISWIYKADMIRVILFLLDNNNLSDAINATAPEPVTNETFTKSVAAHYKRPVLFKAPAFVLKVLLGELSQLFLRGQRVVPEKLLQAGFEFEQKSLDDMLKVIDLKKN